MPYGGRGGEGVIQAFLAKRSAHLRARYETDGRSFRLWGTEIAYWRGDKLQICNQGWTTLLTKSTINDLLSAVRVPCSVYQAKHKWILACRRGDERKEIFWPASGCITVQPRNLPELRQRQAVVEAQRQAAATRHQAKLQREQTQAARAAVKAIREQKPLLGARGRR